MKLLEIQSGKRIFIDANIFLYSAFDHPIFGVACKEFLERTLNREIIGFSSDFALNEVFHKIMIAEVASSQGIETKNAVSIIKKRPEVIEELEKVWSEMELIKSFNINILCCSTFPEFVEISKSYRLLATDAIHAATMNANKITDMATNDRDFERVPWLTLWSP